MQVPLSFLITFRWATLGPQGLWDMEALRSKGFLLYKPLSITSPSHTGVSNNV